MATYEDLRGSTVYDKNNDKIGSLEEFYVDEDTDQPTWVTIKTGLFGTRSNFVPLAQAQQTDDGLQVAVTKDQVKDAPHVDVDEEIEGEEETRLYEYYKGILGGAAASSEADDGHQAEDDENAGPGHDSSGPSTDDAMTRSEEELSVNKETQELGKVRMKKFIVTENVNFTVPVQREEIRLVQEPITDKNISAAKDGPVLSEEEHEVTLHEEQVTIDKQVVPKERVRMEKDVIQDERSVNDTVQKEQIDIEGDGDEDRNR